MCPNKPIIVAAVVCFLGCAPGTAQSPGGAMPDTLPPDSLYVSTLPARATLADPTPGSNDPAPPEPRAADSTCAILLRGVTVNAVDVEGGLALDFSTTEMERVVRLRDLIREMARTQNEHATVDDAATLAPARKATGISGVEAEVPHAPATFTAVVKDHMRGARLIATPQQKKELSAMRRELQLWARQMRDSRFCGSAPTLGARTD